MKGIIKAVRDTGSSDSDLNETVTGIRVCVIETIANDEITVSCDGISYVARRKLDTGLNCIDQLVNGDEIICLFSGEDIIVLGRLMAVSDRVIVSGDQVEIRASQSMLLQCGNVKISLNRNGSVEINGEQIYQNASNMIDLKGAKIFIN